MGRGVIEPERPVKVTDLLIRQKAEAMILWAYSALRQFPKWERHVLAAEMRRTLWSLLRLIVVCNKRYYKKTTLQDLDAEIDLLRSQVRPRDAMSGVLDAGGVNVWIVSRNGLSSFAGGFPGPYRQHVFAGQLGTAIAFSFSVIAVIAKRVLHVFVDSAIGQIRQPVIVKNIVQMPDDGALVAQPVEALQDKAMNGFKRAVFVHRHAEAQIGRRVGRSDSKRLNPYPVATFRSTTTFDACSQPFTAVNIAVQVGGVAVSQRMSLYGNDATIDGDIHSNLVTLNDNTNCITHKAQAKRNLKRLADYYRQGLVSLTRVQQGITSWIAHAQHDQTWGLRQKLLGELTFTRETRHAV